jgi:hypothetical protein
MKSHILIAFLSMALGAGVEVRAQESKGGGALNWTAFESITSKNIFDTTRNGTASYAAKPKTVVVRTFTFRGTIDVVALFTGDGAPKDGYVKVGDLVNGFKVMQITLHYVKLAQPNGDIVVLKEDDSMRREDEGAWSKSDQPPPVVITGPEIRADDSAGTPAPAPKGESDILKRLRLKREQEDK